MTSGELNPHHDLSMLLAKCPSLIVLCPSKNLIHFVNITYRVLLKNLKKTTTEKTQNILELFNLEPICPIKLRILKAPLYEIMLSEMPLGLTH